MFLNGCTRGQVVRRQVWRQAVGHCRGGGRIKTKSIPEQEVSG